MPWKAPGPLLASGRDADIYEHGPHTVLRRARDGRSIAPEARIMEHLHDAGYPVPEISEVSKDGTTIVMERIDGADMVAWISNHPWAVGRAGRILGELHLRLHELAAPDWLRAAPVGTAGDRIVHLDLHPLNVMLTRTGPVVIDWANAAAGDPAIDEALAWAIIRGGQPPARGLMALLVKAGRGWLLANFVRTVGPQSARTVLRDAVTYVAKNPHLTSGEVATMWHLVEKEAL
jgi:aminoglycoside phosphotransferase (APT) family kinase protein